MTEQASRRLAAVLSADVVGYSRHMAENEDATVSGIGELRRRVSERIPEYSGRLVDFTGDNFLAEFTTPLDGLRFSLDLLAEELPLELRIGLHLGEIRDEEGLLFGDTVNIAARIQAFAQPGTVCLTRSVLELVEDRLELHVDNLGSPELKNIPQRVQVFQVTQGVGHEPRKRATATDRDLRRLAVLPFETLTRREEDELLADGMTEDVIGLLSRLPGFHVIARTSTFAYKGRSQDVRRAAEDLGVRYVVTGAVRRSGDRVRVSAQLVDADSGAQIWAERFDRTIDDIFALQDEVTRGIAAQLMPELTNAEASRAARAPPETLDAWSLYQRALSERLRPTTREGLDEAEELLLASLESDDGFAPAVSFLANVVATRFLLGWSRRPKADRARALELATRASAIAPDDPNVLHDRGVVLAVLGDPTDGRALLRRAVELNPNNAHSWAILGYIEIRRGRLAEGIELVERSIDLSPRDPRLNLWDTYLATAYVAEHRWDEVLLHAERATLAFEGFDPPWIYRCVALEKLGRERDARTVAWRFRELHPEADRDSIADLLRRVGPPGAELRDELLEQFWSLLSTTHEAPEAASGTSPRWLP